MRQEDEPVLPEESVLRLIWRDFFKPDLDLAVQPAAFEPRKNEVDGISVFRLECVDNPRDVLAVIADEKRDKYAIAVLPVTAIIALGLTVQPSKIAKVSGHAILPELNAVRCKADRARCKAFQKSLAEIASLSIVHRPVS
ncbi:MAG: hypothetical protein HY289_08565 [Planctomycetes bacterium]|nr:hypothetical protein [Planctomycetota bacterium]